jgi:hypothetical protein
MWQEAHCSRDGASTAALLFGHAPHAMVKVQVRRDLARSKHISVPPAEESATISRLWVELTLLGLIDRPGLEVRCEPAMLLLLG